MREIHYYGKYPANYSTVVLGCTTCCVFVHFWRFTLLRWAYFTQPSRPRQAHFGCPLLPNENHNAKMDLMWTESWCRCVSSVLRIDEQPALGKWELWPKGATRSPWPQTNPAHGGQVVWCWEVLLTTLWSWMTKEACVCALVCTQSVFSGILESFYLVGQKRGRLQPKSRAWGRITE